MRRGIGPPMLAVWLVTASACDETLLDPMAFRQPRARAYKPSPFFADGLTMRPPPEGTVARQWRQELGPMGSAFAAAAPEPAPNGSLMRRYVERMPVPLTRALLARGRERYEIFCGPCHGSVGDGRAPVATQMSLRPPPSLHPYATQPDGYFFDVITRGFGVMPPYADQLSPRDRWAVVAYVRALQISQNSRIDRAPPAVRTRLEREGR